MNSKGIPEVLQMSISMVFWLALPLLSYFPFGLWFCQLHASKEPTTHLPSSAEFKVGSLFTVVFVGEPLLETFVSP